MRSSDSRILGSTFLAALVFYSSGAGANELALEQPVQLHYQEVGESHAYATVESGYRFISPDGATARANPYGVNRSGVTAGFSAGLLEPDLKLRAKGVFLHPDDYQSELFFDYSGMVRADLESRSLYHNLVRRQLFTGFTSDIAPFARYVAVPSTDKTSLGIASRQDRADTRIRFGDFPGHVSLGYWRFTQSGRDQLVVADFEKTNVAAPPNTFYDVTPRIDQVTQEGRIGLDANLGFVNLAYTFKIRDFSNNAPPVAAPFVVAVPSEGRVTSHSFKLFTNISGGLTAAAAYSITQRENTSQRNDLVVSGKPKDTIQHLAGDLAYTPFKEFSVVLKYRHRTIDKETPAQISSYYATPGTYQVRPATNAATDTVILASIWRPDPKVTLRGEYRADLISRTNVWVPMTTMTSQALTSDESQLHSGALSLVWRPSRSTRLNAGYTYISNSRPTTMNDFSDRHIGNLLVDWSSNGRFGANVHYRATAEQNRVTSSTNAVPIVSLVTPRDSLIQSAGVSVWFSPLQRLVVTATYGCMAIDANQALLFSPQTASSLTATSYSSLGHVYGLEGVYTVTSQLDLSFGLQQVRSTANFHVPGQTFPVTGPPLYPAATTAGIAVYNRLDAVESSASTRLDWRFSKHFGMALDYRFSAYRSDDTEYNGDIHSTTVSLTARW